MLTDSSNVAPVNVTSSVPQKQSEIICEEVDCEDINFHNPDPLAQNSRILTFQRFLTRNFHIWIKLSVMNWKCWFLNMSTYFLIFQQGLIKSIMMLTLMVQKQWNNIHIEWISWNCNISERRFSICCTMILLNLAKVIGVLFVFTAKTRWNIAYVHWL